MTGVLRSIRFSRITHFAGWLVVLVLGGCDPIPTWNHRFEGTVSRSVGGAPTAGALVEVWLVVPEAIGASAPLASGQTDASGRFALRARVRSRALPPHATIRVTPPAGSGLGPQTRGGDALDVFPGFEQSGSHTTYFRTTIVLEPAPGP
jgi:hypothetical protein